MSPIANIDEQKIHDIIKPYCQKRPRLFLTIGLYKEGETAIMHEGTRPGQDATASQSSDDISQPIYEIGSITKVFTGILLAKAIREGRVRLDDPITRYVPALASNKSLAEHPVTLRHLATHTSGLPTLPASFTLKVLLSGKVRRNPYVHFSKQNMLHHVAKFNYPAKRKFKYSNLAMGLLGHILADVYEGEYEAVLLDEVIRPLGLADTTIRLSDEQRRRLVPGYDNKNKPASNWDFASLEGAGALRATVQDLLTFVHVNIGGSGHPLEDVLADAHHLLHEEDGGFSTGMAWIVERKSSVIWHNGGTGGYTSFLGFNKQNKTGIVVLSNYRPTFSRSASVDGIGFGLLELMNKAQMNH